jgi:Tetratricopeptide repeat
MRTTLDLSEVKLYFNRQACWGLSWLIGYILLMIWWFAFRDEHSAGLSLACSGAALILAGLVILFIKMGPIIVINTKGLDLNTGYLGTKESMEIPWDQIRSVDVQERYMRGRPHTPNNARLVLTFQLASPLDLKSSGYFKWRPETKELDMNNAVTTGGFKRIVNIIGDFEPRLKNDSVRADLIGPLLARFIGVLLVVAVVGSGALALKEELSSPAPGEKRQSVKFSDEKLFGEEGPILKELNIIEKTGGPDDPRIAGALNELAVLYHNKKQYGKLEKVLMRIITLEEKIYGPENCKVAHRLHSLARIYALQPARYGDAELLYKKAIAICRKSCPDDMYLPGYISELQELYKVWDRT